MFVGLGSVVDRLQKHSWFSVLYQTMDTTVKIAVNSLIRDERLFYLWFQIQMLLQ